MTRVLSTSHVNACSTWLLGYCEIESTCQYPFHVYTKIDDANLLEFYHLRASPTRTVCVELFERNPDRVQEILPQLTARRQERDGRAREGRQIDALPARAELTSPSLLPVKFPRATGLLGETADVGAAIARRMPGRRTNIPLYRGIEHPLA